MEPRAAVGLVFSLVLLAVGAEALVRGAVAVARRAGLSSFFIGLTIVGFGTSTPELATSLGAAIDGRGDLAVGNVVGSNVVNIALILGLTAVVRPIPIRLAVVRAEVRIAIACAFAPLLALTAGNRLTRWHGALLLAGFAAFLVRGYRTGRTDAADAEAARALLANPPVPMPRARLSSTAALALIVAGLAVLVFAADLLVDSASAVARGFGASELAIGVTIVAAGTSMPEFVTSVAAARRGQADVAVGNVLGSNIFNVLAILGTTTMVAPQPVSSGLLRLDTPVLIFASLALLPLLGSGGRLSRLEGSALVLAYAAYTVLRFFA